VNEPLNTIASILVGVAIVATAVRLVAARRPGNERAARLALVTVLGILLAFSFLIATTFLRGWYGGIDG
jgi:uncharacterized membrane protein